MDTALSYANSLLASGAAAEAVRVLSAAAGRGDPEALYTLGLWHVYGQPVRRDFAAARLLFRRAGDAGHKKAALTYAVFVALGAGADPDWPAALRLLDAAVSSDPIAQRQRALIDAMNLTSDGSPAALPTIEMQSDIPEVGIFTGLFSPDECSHVIGIAEPLLVPSVVVDPRTGHQIPNPIRTSFGAGIGPIQQDLVIHALNLRIAAATGTTIDQGEPLVVLRYDAGQQYRQHHDCLPGEHNQRVKTFIAYLNDGYSGGETTFDAADLTIKGRRGNGLAFVNTLPDGRVDERSRHAGQPVTRGQKWICTRWIRQADFDPWGLRTPSPLIKS